MGKKKYKPPENLTDEQKAERIKLIAEHRQKGLRWTDISKILNIEAYNIESFWYRYGPNKEKPKHVEPGHTLRKCMTCRKEFSSQGPHNRMCDQCRALADSSIGG